MPNPSDGLPTDIWAILLRIEAQGVRSEAKIDSLNATVASIGTKQDNHEARLQSIETWRAGVETTGRNAKTWGAAIWTVIGGSVMAFGSWAVGAYHDASKPVDLAPPPGIHTLRR